MSLFATKRKFKEGVITIIRGIDEDYVEAAIEAFHAAYAAHVTDSDLTPAEAADNAYQAAFSGKKKPINPKQPDFKSACLLAVITDKVDSGMDVAYDAAHTAVSKFCKGKTFDSDTIGMIVTGALGIAVGAAFEVREVCMHFALSKNEKEAMKHLTSIHTFACEAASCDLVCKVFSQFKNKYVTSVLDPVYETSQQLLNMAYGVLFDYKLRFEPR